MRPAASLKKELLSRHPTSMLLLLWAWASQHTGGCLCVCLQVSFNWIPYSKHYETINTSKLDQGRNHILGWLSWVKIYMFKTGGMVKDLWSILPTLYTFGRKSFQGVLFGEKIICLHLGLWSLVVFHVYGGKHAKILPL